MCLKAVSERAAAEKVAIKAAAVRRLVLTLVREVTPVFVRTCCTRATRCLQRWLEAFLPLSLRLDAPPVTFFHGTRVILLTLSHMS